MRRGLLLLAVLPLFACSTAEFSPRAVGTLNAGVLNGDELLAEAQLHAASGNFALAVGSYRRALRQSPGHVEAYRGMAAAYEALGRPDLASRYYQEALARAPANEAALQDYAELQDRSDDDAIGPGEPLPVVIGAAATSNAVLVEVPPPAAIAASPPPAQSLPRLERISRGEVALITRQAPRRAMAADNRPRALPGRALPIQLVRSTGRELVFELGSDSAQAAPRTVPLRILNAVGRLGQAGRMRGYLRNLGWARLSVGDASVRRAASVVIAPPGMSGEARALARSLPFRATVRTAPTGSQIVLILGRDAVQFDLNLARNARRA